LKIFNVLRTSDNISCNAETLSLSAFTSVSNLVSTSSLEKNIIIINNKNNNNNKVMHGQYIRSTDRQLISEEDTFLWLLKGDLKAETESEIVAAQDRVLQTKYYATKILNTETDSKCRLCKQFDETIEHIILACPTLAKEQYIKRHGKSMCTTTLQHMQGNRSKIGQKALV
jgi:hypothetical protein